MKGKKLKPRTGPPVKKFMKKADPTRTKRIANEIGTHFQYLEFS